MVQRERSKGGEIEVTGREEKGFHKFKDRRSLNQKLLEEVHTRSLARSGRNHSTEHSGYG